MIYKENSSGGERYLEELNFQIVAKHFHSYYDKVKVIQNSNIIHELSTTVKMTNYFQHKC